MKIKILIDHCGRPYLARFEILAAFGWSLKLHTFIRSDADEELHDHPWSFWTLVLAGRYMEQTETGVIERKPWSLAYRPAAWRHRVILNAESGNWESPCVTLVLTAPKSREWGFWKGVNFTPWSKFVSARRCD